MSGAIRDRRPTLWWCESTERRSAADRRIIREGDIWNPGNPTDLDVLLSEVDEIIARHSEGGE